MSSRRSVTRASAPLQGRAARASSRDVKKVQTPTPVASKRRQEVALPVRKAAPGKTKRKRGDGDSDEDEEQEASGADRKAKLSRVETPVDSKKVSIDAKQDEMLMKAVVAHEKKLTAPKTKKMPVWDSIAKSCGGRFTTGHTAFGKVKWLQRVVRDKRHPLYEFLTPTLVKLLKQYLQFTEAPHKDGGADDEHVTMKEVVEDEEEDEADEVAVETTRKGVKNRRVSEANVAEEEEMMAIVLKHASRFGLAEDDTPVWSSIARESKGRFENGLTARHHYDQLLQWLNPTHYRHSLLTPILRVQLKELQDSGYNKSATKEEKAGARGQKDTPATASVSTPQAKAAVVATKPGAAGKDGRVPPTRLPNTREDDWLLYEILRVRPFDHKGESNPYWEKILASLNQRLGSSDVFPDRTVCQKRMSKLLNAVRRPDHPSTPPVTPLQLEVLKVIHSILELKYQWASMMKEKTPYYLSVVAQIDTLQEQIKPKPGSETKPTLAVATRPALGELPELPAVPEVRVEDEETKDSEPTPSSLQPGGSQLAVSRELHAVKQILSSTKIVSLTNHTSRLERERRDNAKAFDTMLHVLQDEREQLQRQSESVLRKVERQRVDRKDEFKTMINLVALAAAQYRA